MELTPGFSNPLTAVDRCDRCGAQAYVRAVLPLHTELLFCNHHYQVCRNTLGGVAVYIHDESHLLFDRLAETR
ncbi:hypothetical protein ABZV60_33130 [Streptomyces sp. NPDC004787]|uniref:DUF7455 domain-containing protein n=1 Tax=Streptomyces sp. NPDC004787 TaxID=3154291 RepID=UPI0033ACC3A5